MLELQDCINKLTSFKSAFAQKFGITKLGIFGSVARKEVDLVRFRDSLRPLFKSNIQKDVIYV